MSQDAEVRTTTEAWLPALRDEEIDKVGRVLDSHLAALGVRAAAHGRLRELIEGVWWSGGDGAGGRAEVVGVIREVIPLVSGTPTEPLLALYIRVVCEAAWDLTWDHRPLLEVLDAAEDAWVSTPPVPQTEAALAVRAALALRADLSLESACSTGDLRSIVRAARDGLHLLEAELAAVDLVTGPDCRSTSPSCSPTSSPTSGRSKPGPPPRPTSWTAPTIASTRPAPSCVPPRRRTTTTPPAASCVRTASRWSG